jgi:UDP-2,3-diacylglucosamine hydrolase
MSQILFISDLHLSKERPATVALFLRFLEEIASGAERLYILGDLFDVWLGDDDESSPIPDIQFALARLTASGTRVLLMHGNRDFLIGERFCEITGCELIPDPTLLELNGKPALLVHGDLLCTDDVNYQQARKMLRNEQIIADFLAKSLQERALFAGEIRKQSGETTSLLAEDIMDVNRDEVEEQMRRHGVELLIHGHTHRAATHELELDGRAAKRVVLADWHEEQGHYLRVDDQGLTECRFPQ